MLFSLLVWKYWVKQFCGSYVGDIKLITLEVYFDFESCINFQQLHTNSIQRIAKDNNNVTYIKVNPIYIFKCFLLLRIRTISKHMKYAYNVIKELARIHGKLAHLANCSQLFKKSFLDKNIVPLATTINYWEHQTIILILIRIFCMYLMT